jgi:hypothetical protein
VTLVLDEYIEKFHIPVKKSLEAYIIPHMGSLRRGKSIFALQNSSLDGYRALLYTTVQ